MPKFFVRRLSWALLLTSFIAVSVQAQQNDELPITQTSSRKQVDLVRTELAPVLDGVLDDEIWQQATVIRDMHQYDPVDQGVPSESSVFYITYSERYFYLAARLYDSDPSAISARQLIQGQGLGFDDSVELILDTFNNRRTGYHFQVNPNGIRREGVYEAPNSRNGDWTGIWQVEARVDDEGWTAEIAIPFNTLNFDPALTDWGFTVGRTIARKQEEIAWASYNRNLNPSTTGIISGIHDIRQGRGLDIIPSLAVSGSEDYITGDKVNNVEPSLNVFYKFTPNLTGALTFNTDFSATEVDNRQVNLSRFSLFFPEKRDFFLQDVDIFSFGSSGGGNFGNNTNGIPFYSRRIGLSSGSGQPVDILAGGKLTGRVGRWSVGGLAVQQDEFSYTDFSNNTQVVDSQAVFVGRVSANVLGESKIGAIFTSGDPNSNLDNSVVGTDFTYQNTRFSPNYSLRANAWYQQSDTEGLSGGDEKAWSVGVNLDTQQNGFGGSTSYTYIGEDFNPALGFANRKGIEDFNLGGSGRYFFQNGGIFRNVFTFSRFGYVRDVETGEMQSQNWFWRMINLNTNRGDQIGFGLGRNREGLDRDFNIRPGIVIPEGDYAWTGYHLDLQASNQRDFSPSLRYDRGDYYTGEREQWNLGLGWRPNEHVVFNVNYQYQDIQLPEGDILSRLISANINYAFDAKWSWVNLLQYDNFSNSVGLNSRLRWNPRAGEDMFLVINYNFDAEGVLSHLSSRSSEIVLKYTKTFRF